jgi:murein DD-endopeptidase MepM/ murein hydrolase activator NlpD
MSKGTNGFNHGVPKGAAWIGKTSGRGSGGGKKGGGCLGALLLFGMSVTVVAAAILSSMPGRTVSLRHIQTPASAAPSASTPEDAAPRSAVAALAGSQVWYHPLPGSCRPSWGGGQYLAPRNGYRHQGVDLGGIERFRVGRVVLSVGPGTVIRAGWNGNAGLQVQVRHDDGSVAKYNHLSYVNVRYGQRVVGGNHIGSMGRTGNASGPHLHFEIWWSGTHHDPVAWLSGHGIRIAC